MEKDTIVFHVKEVNTLFRIDVIDSDHVILVDSKGHRSEFPRRYFDNHFLKLT